jgi:leucyl aminopeptidase
MMKIDMGGMAAVFGTARAIAELKPEVRLFIGFYNECSLF